MIHSFHVEVAKKLGVPEAILVSNICYWIKKNQANGKHLYDGKYWTYNSAKAFAELFPYWNEKQVYRLITKLENDGIILSGNYNERGYDRTKWYTVIDESISRLYEIHFPESENAIPEIVQPIPDSKLHIENTDSKPEENNIKEVVEEIYKAYPSKCVVQGRSTGKSRVKHPSQIRKALKHYTHEDLMKIISRYTLECKENNTYMMNFGTFLNNIPDFDGDNEIPFTHEARQYVETKKMPNGVGLKSLLGKSYHSLTMQYKKEAEDNGLFVSPEGFDTWCIEKVKEKFKL